MPRDGLGTYTAPSNSFNPATTGTTISTTDWNACLADLVAAITASIAKDGQTATTVKMPFAFGVDLSAATGGQINFPATANPSAGANVLDDYEEGTFTPTLGDTTGNLFSLTLASGGYTKIGNLVQCNVVISWNSIGSADATQLKMSGLPFTSLNVAYNTSPCALSDLNGFDTTATENLIMAQNTQNSSVIVFKRASDNAAPTNLAANSCSSGGAFKLAVCYRAT